MKVVDYLFSTSEIPVKMEKWPEVLEESWPTSFTLRPCPLVLSLLGQVLASPVFAPELRLGICGTKRDVL